VAFEEFGPPITRVVEPEFAKVEWSKDRAEGVVLHVDDFGNIITNVPSKEVAAFRDALLLVQFGPQKEEMRVSSTYANAKPSEPVALIGSHNYLEIALNQGNAAAKYSVKAGDKVTISKT
jgi:S-adenosylmethionine hydrolase